MALQFAADIPSAVSIEECQKLGDLAKGKIVIELGSHFGRSTVALASMAARVHAVDWHRGDNHAGLNDSLDAFVANINRYRVRDKVVMHVGRFEDVLPLFKPASFDLAFIDGFHEREAVSKDLGMVTPLIKPDGVIAFHDYGLPAFGVTGVLTEFASARGLKVDVTRTLAVLQLK